MSLITIHKSGKLPLSKLLLILCWWKHCLYLTVQTSWQRLSLSSFDIWEEPKNEVPVAAKPFLCISGVLFTVK